MSGLVSVEAALRAVAAMLGPTPVRRMAVEEAIGLRLAAPAVAPADLPRAAVALRAGLAVRSLDLAGASAHAPVTLAARPGRVAVGEAAPEGCDAVVDPDAVTGEPPLLECAEPAEPGAWMRLPGHDARAGTILGARGERVCARLALALAAAGVAEVEVAAAPVRLDLEEASPEGRWLARALTDLGCLIVRDAPALLTVRRADPRTRPRLALQPGETAWIAAGEDGIVIELPSRFDGCVAGFAALVAPAVAAMTGAAVARRQAVLTRKLSSRLGVVELALLRQAGETVEPLGVGDLTLAHLARADAFALLPPDSEGFAAGDCIAVTPFDAMLAGAPS